MPRFRLRAPHHLAFALLTFLAGYMSLAQPGLCSCWLIADVGEVHPHPDAQPERPHHHDYLFEMFQVQNAAIASVYVVAADALIALLAVTGLWRWIFDDTPGGNGWSEPPSTPPPRFALPS